ncbi:diguanylate cyclase domain-containing protein [Marinimicrobium sp. C2-29]|uniref:diguanylate cyclase domain-containing protein n=1 Tax=Marinimicrobium sp. C2-29 TaxID=3139825 RepID=UPI003138D57D
MTFHPDLPLSQFTDLLLDAVCVVDQEGRFVFISAAGERIFGYTPEEMIGRPPTDFVHPDDRGKTEEAIGDLIGGEPKPYFENRYIRKDGSVVNIMWSARWSDDYQIRVAVARDITESARLKERLEFLALHDPLTNLPNRSLFFDRLRTALVRAHREQSRFAVLFLDLDRFKAVNDSLGHSVGDHLLRTVAQRLHQSVRQSDTLGRLGGDEFVILINGLDQPDDARVVADKVAAALSAPYELEGHTVIVSASIGIAVYPEHGEDELELVRHADHDMYQAKGYRDRTQ